MSRVLPFGPVQAAELADVKTKRLATARARCALLRGELRSLVADDGTVTFAIGMRRFATIDQVEDFLDHLVDE